MHKNLKYIATNAANDGANIPICCSEDAEKFRPTCIWLRYRHLMCALYYFFYYSIKCKKMRA